MKFKKQEFRKRRVILIISIFSTLVCYFKATFTVFHFQYLTLIYWFESFNSNGFKQNEKNGHYIICWRFRIAKFIIYFKPLLHYDGFVVHIIIYSWERFFPKSLCPIIGIPIPFMVIKCHVSISGLNCREWNKSLQIFVYKN